MPIPMEIQYASRDFEAFLADAQAEAGLPTRNPTYTMVQGVLLVFRRRLTPRQALAFADVLPPVLRAIFVEGWDVDRPPVPFAPRDALAREVQDLRRDHNFAPDTAIGDVARALRRHVDAGAIDRVLARLPPEAAAFWEA